MTTIDVIVYSYKNKNLKLVVDNILKTSENISHVHVYDQHPLDRAAHFSHSTKIRYHHIFWDLLHSPCKWKKREIHEATGDFVAIVGDDILLEPGWDLEAIKIINESQNPTIISGFGEMSFVNKDIFALEINSVPKNHPVLNKVISRNFIFGKTWVIKSLKYPDTVKYYGEQELISFRAFEQGIEVWSLPFYFATNLEEKTLETKYKTFSLEHGYNDAINSITTDFWKHLGFSECPVTNLPYHHNDVVYDPNRLKFNDLDSTKFFSNVKSIS